MNYFSESEVAIMNLHERIKATLKSKEESNRKAISINLDLEMLEKVDKVAKEFSKVGEKNYSRNSIIEMAIQEYINEAEKVLMELNDNQDSHEEEDAIKEFNLAIFPGYNDGFEETFIGEDCWYPVRIKENKIPKIKYVAIYRAAPISGITHYAKVKEMKQYIDTNKKIIHFDGKAIELPHVIKIGDTKPTAMRSPRYTTLAKLKNAYAVADLF